MQQSNNTLYTAFLFFSLLFLQVFILNNIVLFGYINPYVYISFVLLYPLRINKLTFLTLSFLLGLCVDFFSNSGGIHAFSTLFIAYIRLFFIKSIFKISESEYPHFNLRQQSFDKIFNYAVILTVIHHLFLFSLANFSFNNYINVLTNTLFSSIFTLFLYFLGTFIFSRKQ